MLTSTQLVVRTNDQYAYLDPQRNGQQISHQHASTYSGDNSTACPAALSGGMSGVAVNDLDRSGGVQAHKTVVQLATPRPDRRAERAGGGRTRAGPRRTGE
jgi:hypothetical protein